MQCPSTHRSILSALADADKREEAWAAFQARYRDWVLAWGRRRGLPADAAEDLAQDVAVKLCQDLERYDRARGPFRNWLKAVVNNAITDFWRRQRHRPEPPGVGGSAYLDQLRNLAADGTVEELTATIDRQTKALAGRVFRRVRGRVEESTWQAFYQRLVEERPAEEVAAALGLSVGTVYKYTLRVKRLVREEARNV